MGAWMSNNIPVLYVDAITYPFPKLNAGLANYILGPDSI